MLTNLPFYFSSVRNLTAVFGSLFNDIKIQRISNTGAVESTIKVPLSYGPADKTITMLRQQSKNRIESNPEIKISLPRASFELSSMTYDSARKITSVQKNVMRSDEFSFDPTTISNNTINIPSHKLFTGRSLVYNIGTGGLIPGLINGSTYWVIVVDRNNIRLASSKAFAEAGNALSISSSLISGISKFTSANLSGFVPIPYNFEYTLNLFVKYIDDGLQIIEQILPYFTPFYTVTMNDFVAPDLKRDVTITLNSVSQEDVYEGLVEEDRLIQWSLTFLANAWIYPPVSDTKVIKIAKTNFFELDTDQKLTTVTVEVNPLTANRNDIYTIDTSIEEG